MHHILNSSFLDDEGNLNVKLAFVLPASPALLESIADVPAEEALALTAKARELCGQTLVDGCFGLDDLVALVPVLSDLARRAQARCTTYVSTTSTEDSPWGSHVRVAADELHAAIGFLEDLKRGPRRPRSAGQVRARGYGLFASFLRGLAEAEAVLLPFVVARGGGADGVNVPFGVTA